MEQLDKKEISLRLRERLSEPAMLHLTKRLIAIPSRCRQSQGWWKSSVKWSFVSHSTASLRQRLANRFCCLG